MAKNKIGLQFDGLEDVINRLEKAQGNVRGAIEETLVASKQYVTDALKRDTTKANYPAGGKYSTGELAKSIDSDTTVKWRGNTAEINVGYDFKKGGLTSVFLMYGTPKHAKVQKLYNDVYGSATKKKLAELQQETLNQIIERTVQGGR